MGNKHQGVAAYNCIAADVLSLPLLLELPEVPVHLLPQALPKKIKHALY